MLFEELSATLRASALRASISARRASNDLRLVSLARSAFFCGNRKLRAKPSRTFTSSPMPPRFSTRSSRMTCMFQSSSLNRERQQREFARELDGAGEFTLLLGGHRGDAGWYDLALFGDEALQQLHILVVDLRAV